MENDCVASFIDVGKLLKRTAPENLNVFFPSVRSFVLSCKCEQCKIVLIINNLINMEELIKDM